MSEFITAIQSVLLAPFPMTCILLVAGALWWDARKTD